MGKSPFFMGKLWENHHLLMGKLWEHHHFLWENYGTSPSLSSVNQRTNKGPFSSSQTVTVITRGYLRPGSLMVTKSQNALQWPFSHYLTILPLLIIPLLSKSVPVTSPYGGFLKWWYPKIIHEISYS